MQVDMPVQYHADRSLLHFAFSLAHQKLPILNPNGSSLQNQSTVLGNSISGRSCIVTVEIDVQRRSVSPPS
jgi:hypothetical protein